MRRVVNWLLVDADEPLVRRRADQLLMDGYEVEGVSAVDAARIKLGEGPDALVVCGAPEPICLVRELRAAAIPRADSRLRVLVVGADDDPAGVRCDRAGVQVALPSESSPVLAAAGLDALARRTGGEERRQILSAPKDLDACRAHPRGVGLRPVGGRAVSDGGTPARSLRRKLEQAGVEPMVQSVRGVGWRLTR